LLGTEFGCARGTGEDADVLYVTAGKGLYRIGVNSTGYQLPTD